MKNVKPLFLFFLCLFSGFLVISGILFFTFLRQNDLTWSEYWQNSEIYGSIPLPQLKFTKGIRTRHQELTFPAVPKIGITVDIETVSFVEEDRADILVVYDYRHPNSPEYDINFKAFLADDLLQITATTKARQQSSLPIATITSDGIYRGSVTIHLPTGFHLQSLSLATSLLEINQAVLYENSDDYVLSSLMGNIDLVFSTPKRLISLDADLGNVSVTAKAPVKSLDLFSNLGNAYLNFTDSLDTLYVLNTFGNSVILLEKGLSAATAQSNVGDITLFLANLPESLNIYTLTGNITAYLAENSVSVMTSAQGSVSSYFSIPAIENPAFSFFSTGGDIRLLAPEKADLDALKAENYFGSAPRPAPKQVEPAILEEARPASGSSIWVE